MFVALTEGFNATLGFRGLEETRQRKERIDTKLHQELDDEIEDFLSGEECRNPDRIDAFQYLGFRAMLAEDAANDLIKGSDKNMKASIRFLLLGTAILFVTAVEFVNSNFSNLVTVVLFLLYVGAAGYIFWKFATFTINAMHFRERLIELDEKTTLDKAEELDT